MSGKKLGRPILRCRLVVWAIPGRCVAEPNDLVHIRFMGGFDLLPPDASRPRAASKSLQSVLEKNPNPTIVTDKVMVRTSAQMSDYLLCAECEARFDRNGERWILPRISHGSSNHNEP